MYYRPGYSIAGSLGPDRQLEAQIYYFQSWTPPALSTSFRTVRTAHIPTFHIMPVLSICTPLGPGSSTCGYCGPLGERSTAESSFKKAGLISPQLSCEVRSLHHTSIHFSESLLGLSKDDRPRVETFWHILLCSRSKTLVLSSIHYQVCYLLGVLCWGRRAMVQL